jgi:hypothetical protein
MLKYHPKVFAVPIIWACLAATLAAAEKPLEGPIDVFLGEPRMEVQTLFETIRHPNIVVTLKGTVLATLGDKKLLARRSEDGGKTWKTSKPFAERGTGEAAIAELSDGRLYYNSRSHWNAEKPPLRRREAWSDDGGETWTGWKIVEALARRAKVGSTCTLKADFPRRMPHGLTSPGYWPASRQVMARSPKSGAGKNDGE